MSWSADLTKACSPLQNFIRQTQPLTPATALRQLTQSCQYLSAWKKSVCRYWCIGEVTHADIDIFDREARFIESVMEPLRQRLTALKVVFEHITTKDAADYVRDGNERLAATITPQHLMFNRNHMLVGRRASAPVLSTHPQTQYPPTGIAWEPVASGFNRVFLGTDSAPHARHRKESSCGCAGCFNAPTALGSYATVFEEMNALQHFEAFCSVNGPQFYGLPVNDTFIELVREEQQVAESIALTDDTLVPFLAGETVRWSVKQ